MTIKGAKFGWRRRKKEAAVRKKIQIIKKLQTAYNEIDESGLFEEEEEGHLYIVLRNIYENNPRLLEIMDNLELIPRIEDWTGEWLFGEEEDLFPEKRRWR